MELVYLWVEDYKNIQNQGFNFSPRFHCEYDEEKNELTIDENDDYIENFFGENINVTAIVGKNGSGKSNLLISLLDSISKIVDKNLFKLCVIYFYNNEYFIDNYQSSIKSLNNKIMSKYRKSFCIYTLYYNYSLDYAKSLNNQDLNQTYSEFRNDVDAIDYSPILLQPTKSKYLIYIDKIDNYAMKEMLYYSMGYNTNIKEIENFFIPTHFRLTVDTILANKIKELGYSTLFEVISLFNDNSKKMSTLSFDFFKIIHNINLAITIQREINNPYSPYIFSELLKKEVNKQENYYHVKTTNEQIKLILNYLSNNPKYNDILKNDVVDIMQNFNFLESLDKNSNISREKKEIKFNRVLLESLPTWINIELINEKNISFNNLSHGQQFLIKFIYNLLNRIHNLHLDENYRVVNILLDEVEIGLHPTWQKRIIWVLTSILQAQKEFKFNLLIASHSAFVLSDLPKENIIFLKDGKNNKGITNKQTFGANIHTLLSDSFFMEDGLMGEFAKGKIDEVIRYLNGNTDTKIRNDDEAQKLVNIIGEPIVKNQLQRMLDSKRLNKVDEIDAIKKSMEAMQKRLDELEK